jgi:hypothetical protein
MKPLYIAIIGFILVLILAAAAFYLLIHFDPSRIKTNISNRFEDMSGRKVKISGNLDISKTAISTAITLGKAIGGALLFGPAGLLAALVDLDIGEDNPYISAMKKAVTEEKSQAAATN